ncbi:Serine carboxypeptidase 3 [Exophiala oligosperma]
MKAPFPVSMGSFGICTQCMRALRQSVRQENSVLLARSPASSRRHLSVQQTEPRFQTQSTKSSIHLNVPTATPTNTTNLTAEIPEDASKAEAQPEHTKSKSPQRQELPTGPSVAHMQAQIQQSLRRPAMANPLASRVAQSLRKSAKGATQTYITYGETETLFKSCAAQADYTIPEDQRMGILTGQGPPKTADGIDLGHPVRDTWWFETIGLPPTFSTWSQVAFLHMYIITVRMRAVDTTSEFQDYQRYLIEHFSSAAEDKMVLLHNMSARGVRNKYLKDLFLQWRGILAAHDEGLIKGDAVLAGAVWRNLFRGQEDVDWEKVALVVAFLRRAIAKTGNLDIKTIVRGVDGPEGIWAQSQRPLQELVDRESGFLKAPLAD